MEVNNSRRRIFLNRYGEPFRQERILTSVKIEKELGELFETKREKWQ
jgi:hypothetical protein